MTKAGSNKSKKRKRRALNISGKKFGRLSALKPIRKTANGTTVWRCICDCGAQTEARVSQLRDGSKQSCGCLRRDIHSARLSTQNGMSKHPLWPVYRNMISRCHDPKNKDYSNYGGRGIKVCRRWRDGTADKLGVECFVEDMNSRPSGASLDRRDNDKGYSKANCRWVSHSTQCNNRRSNVIIEFNGDKRTVSEWARYFNIKCDMLKDHLQRKPFYVAIAHCFARSHFPELV